MGDLGSSGGAVKALFCEDLTTREEETSLPDIATAYLKTPQKLFSSCVKQ